MYVVNLTSQAVSWQGLKITGNEAVGGAGGAGGSGGTGGAGGPGVHSDSGSAGFPGYPAGVGGRGDLGGSGGNAGASGEAFGAGLMYLAIASGTLDLADVAITANRAIAGTGGAGGTGGTGGAGGAGGNGSTGYPNGGDGGPGVTGGAAGEGHFGASAEGGGIRFGFGTLNLLNATVATNDAAGGAGGPTGQRGAPGAGGAGGQPATGGTPGSAGSTGNFGATPLINGHGGHAFGGGIHVSAATTKLRQSTVASNQAIGANSGLVLALWNDGGGGAGGGLYVADSTATLSHSTLSLNQVRAGTGSGLLGTPGGTTGGGIWTVDNANSSTTLNHTIVAGNLRMPPGMPSGPSDLFGKPVQATSAFNLIGTGGAGGLTHGVNGNLVGIANPMLGPLTDNGGTTHTMRPLLGSPAIDAGDRFFQPSGDLLLDQRGRPRVMRGAVQTETNDFVGLAEIKFGTTGGQVVTPVNAFASSFFGGTQSPTNLINNSGLDTSSGNVMTFTHAPHGSAAGMWAAGNGQGGGNPAPVVVSQYVVLDLGANHNLSQAYVWQMVQTNLIGRGIKEFRLYGSPNAPSPADAANPPAVYNLSGYNLLLDTTTMAPGPQTGPSTTQAFALNGATNVRTIYLDVISSYNTGPRIDIGAVEANKYFVASSAEFLVDEPQPSVRFTLSELIDPASVSPSDVQVVQMHPLAIPPIFVPATGVSVAGKTVTFRIPASTPDAIYEAKLVTGSVSDTLGNPLVADITHRFLFLPGDANSDRSVNIADFAIVAANFNQPGVFSQGDFNYSGTVEIGDFAILASKFNTSWPAPFARPGVVSDPARGSASKTAGRAAPVGLALAEPSPFSNSRVIEGVIGLID